VNNKLKYLTFLNISRLSIEHSQLKRQLTLIIMSRKVPDCLWHPSNHLSCHYYYIVFIQLW